jgi:hypothetical protein
MQRRRSLDFSLIHADLSRCHPKPDAT